MDAIGEAGAHEQGVDFVWVWVQGYAALPRCCDEQLLELGDGTAAW